MRHHTDMIDALFKYEFPQKVLKTKSPHATWLLSASRDRKITLWKLIDGKVMRKSEYPTVVKTTIDNNKRSGGGATDNNHTHQ